MTSRLRPQPLSKVDAAWYRMNTPTNMMMITAVMMFDEPIDFRRLRAVYEHRFLGRHPLFTMRIREGKLLAGPRWEEDPRFDLSLHLHRIALPSPDGGPAGQAELQDLVGDLMSTPLDYDKPPWQVHLVDNFGAGCAVVTRLSHAFADGMALTRILLDLCDDRADAEWPGPDQDGGEYKMPLLSRLTVQAMTALDDTLRVGETMYHEGMETLVHPSRLLNVGKSGVDVSKAAGKLLLLGPDQKTVLRGKCGVQKRAAWTQSFSLEDVKAVGRMLGGTVNDVLLACVAGGLRRYLEGRGEKPDGLNIRAMVPVNLRPAEEMSSLGNYFGLIYLSLPVGIEDPMERLQELKRRMDAIKNSPEALVAFQVLNATGMTPNQIEQWIVPFFGMKATAVMTNVPGPRQQLWYCGVPLKKVMSWVPQAANIGLGVSILSYNGSVIIGIASDAGLTPDPEKIVACLEADFEELKDYVRYVREDDTRPEDYGLPVGAATESGK